MLGFVNHWLLYFGGSDGFFSTSSGVGVQIEIPCYVWFKSTCSKITCSSRFC